MLRDRLKRCAAFMLMAASIMASGVLPVPGQKRKPPRYTVPADTTIRVQLNNKLSSKSARVGDTFTSTVTIPIYVRGVEVIPAGSIVTGSITQVTPASRKSQAGSLNATFTSIKMPNGKVYSINGSLASSENADNEGTVKGKSSKKRNAAFIGRGVVVGGLLNGAAGAATGGVIGIARGRIKKGEEAEINPGTEYNIILNRNVSMLAFR